MFEKPIPVYSGFGTWSPKRMTTEEAGVLYTRLAPFLKTHHGNPSFRRLTWDPSPCILKDSYLERRPDFHEFLRFYSLRDILDVTP